MEKLRTFLERRRLTHQNLVDVLERRGVRTRCGTPVTTFYLSKMLCGVRRPSWALAEAICAAVAAEYGHRIRPADLMVDSAKGAAA